MSKPKHKRSQPAPMAKTPPSRTTRWWWWLALLAVVAIVAYVATRPAPKPTPNPPAASASASANQDRLLGRWLRPDGGYVIEVRGAEPAGRLDAAYFNPQSINVSRAEWRREGEALHVFVELRDVNYPGATYKLRYVPTTDTLAGEYFQPRLGQAFEVEFVRLPR